MSGFTPCPHLSGHFQGENICLHTEDDDEAEGGGG